MRPQRNTPRARAVRVRHGFTLLELLVSVTILAVVAGMVYGALQSATTSVAIASEVTEELRVRQFLSSQFQDVLSTAYMDPAGGREAFQFVGEESGGAFGPADSLRFVSTEPLTGSRSLPGVLKVVTIEAGTDEAAEQLSGLAGEEEARQHITLMYQEAPLVLEGEDDFAAGFQFDEEDYASWRVPVQTFDVAFYDGEEWVETWDTLSERMMPWAVRLRINFAKDEEAMDEDAAAGIDRNEFPDYEAVMPMPLGKGALTQFVPLNPAIDQEEGDDLFQQ